MEEEKGWLACLYVQGNAGLLCRQTGGTFLAFRPDSAYADGLYGARRDTMGRRGKALYGLLP